MDKDVELMDETERLFIPDDDGNEVEYEVIMWFEKDDDKKYVLVVPVESQSEDDEEEEVFAFRYEENGEELTLFMIEDEQEWDEVEETYNTIMMEMEAEEEQG